MGPLIIRPTKTTPLVWFDASAGTGVVVGTSLPENAAELYDKLIEWLDHELPFMTKPMRWTFRLTYFSTSSTKGLYQVMRRIKAHIDTGHAHTVVWDVEEDDEFMQESGESFVDLLGLRLEFRILSEDAATLENQRLNVAMEDELAGKPHRA